MVHIVVSRINGIEFYCTEFTKETWNKYKGVTAADNWSLIVYNKLTVSLWCLGLFCSVIGKNRVYTHPHRHETHG